MMSAEARADPATAGVLPGEADVLHGGPPQNNVYMCVCIYIYIYTHVYTTYTYIYIYIYTHT